MRRVNQSGCAWPDGWPAGHAGAKSSCTALHPSKADPADGSGARAARSHFPGLNLYGMTDGGGNAATAKPPPGFFPWRSRRQATP